MSCLGFCMSKIGSCLPGVRFSVHPVTPAVPRLAVGDRERCVPAGRGQRGREACLNEVGHADDTAR